MKLVESLARTIFLNVCSRFHFNKIGLWSRIFACSSKFSLCHTKSNRSDNLFWYSTPKKASFLRSLIWGKIFLYLFLCFLVVYFAAHNVNKFFIRLISLSFSFVLSLHSSFSFVYTHGIRRQKRTYHASRKAL